MIDFSLPPELQALKARVDRFVRDEVIPFEKDPRVTPHGPTDELRQVLIAKAKAAGLLSAHAKKEWGGLGLDHRSKAVILEASGFSTLGALALNVAAPDEGNMHLLELVASDAQKQKFLKPLVAGETRSAFLMTEPDGAGADPKEMKTVAVPDGDGWRINGRKWLITGFRGSACSIIAARTQDASGTELGVSLWVVESSRAGLKELRLLDTMDRNHAGGHSELALADVRVTRDDLIGEVGKGLRYIQMRLGPARLTHCMRWLGQAVRCHEIACDYARRRRSMGHTLAEHQGVLFHLADNEIDLETARLMIWKTAWVLDQGERGSRETSLTKVQVSEAVNRVVDRCVQVLGGRSVTTDTIVEQTYRDIRAFRIYDGPNEVHRWAVMRHLAGPVDKGS